MITIMIEEKKALRFTLLCQYERSSGSVIIIIIKRTVPEQSEEVDT